MKIEPVISVVMSVYNEPIEWMKIAIDSILNQSFSDFEFIIINDNPNRKENSELLQEYQKKDNRIVIISNEQNIGLTKSLNKGLEIANGKYIARMDADDISVEDRFEKQVSILEANPHIGIIGCWILFFGEGKRTHIQKKLETDEQLKVYMLFSSPFDHPATIMRTSFMKTYGIKYDESLRYAQDQKIWFEFSKVSEFYNIQEVLFKYRVNANQISSLHREEQMSIVRKIRLEQVEYFFGGKGIDISLKESVTCNTITKLKQIRVKYHNDELTVRKINTIINVFFLSLNKYNIQTLFYFLFSFEYLRKGWSLNDFIRIVIKHFSPKRFLGGGIRI